MSFVIFPSVAPSSRSFSPGEFPQAVFEAQNGAKSFIRYGNKRVNATLNLGFTNITNADATKIIRTYIQVAGDPTKYLYFNATNGTAGILYSQGVPHYLNDYIKGYDDAEYALSDEDPSSGGLRWRFSGPPNLQSSVPGYSNVTCSFVGCLDGD